MGNTQAEPEQQKKCLPGRKGREQEKKGAEEPHQAVPSVSKILNTNHEQQFSGLSEVICKHSGGTNKATSTTPQTSVSVTTPLLSASLSECPPNTALKSVCQPPFCFPLAKKASAVPKEAYPETLLPETVQLLEKTDHSLKESKTPVTTKVTVPVPYTITPISQSKTAEVPATSVSQKPQTTAKGADDGKHATVEQPFLNSLSQTDSRSDYVKKHEHLQMQEATGKALNVISYVEAVKGTPLKVNPAHREQKEKQTAKKAKMNKSTSKKTTHSELGAVPSTIPSKILNKTTTAQRPIAAMKQSPADPKQGLNSKGFFTPEPASYKTQQTSETVSALKSAGDTTNTAKSPLLSTHTVASYKEATSGHQPLTNTQTTIIAKPPTSPTTAIAHQKEIPRKSIATTQVVSSTSYTTKPVSSTLARSARLSSGISKASRMKLKAMRQSKSKAAAVKPEGILSSVNGMQGKKEACKNVQKEASKGVEKQTPNCFSTPPIHEFLAKLSMDDFECTHGESHSKKYSVFLSNDLSTDFQEDLAAAINKAFEFNAVFPNTSSSSQTSQPTAFPVSQVPEDSASEGETVHVETPSEAVQDTSADPLNTHTTICPQRKVRKKTAVKTKKSMTAKAGVVKEVKTQEALPPLTPSPEHPSRPAGRWHPFTTDPACLCRVWCSHKSSPALPRNVRRWLDVKQNYLCEPPWVTTATLAASLAFRLKQENSDLCL